MPVVDRVGYWSEIKLDIVRKYAQAYSRIMARQGFSHVYVDAFAGAGVHISRGTEEFVLGSPLNAIRVTPPFREYYFIDIDERKLRSLEDLAEKRPDVHIFHGDCNSILLKDVFPNIRYENYRRGLCLLDPYGLHLDWTVIQGAGEMRSVEIFLNFPIVDMNRNVLWHSPDRVGESQLKRMNRFWGDESWRDVAYTHARTLFGEEDVKATNEAIARAFGERLRNVARIAYVPDPMPMRNSKGSIIYYLFFASPKEVAGRIVTDIFAKYRERQR